MSKKSNIIAFFFFNTLLLVSTSVSKFLFSLQFIIIRWVCNTTRSQTTATTPTPLLPHIPNDIVVQILYRVPANSLLQIRWTCKFWFDLITKDSCFSKMHILHHHKHHHHSTSFPLLIYNKKQGVVHPMITNYSLSTDMDMDMDTTILLRSNMDDDDDSYYNLSTTSSSSNSNYVFDFYGSFNGLIFLRRRLRGFNSYGLNVEDEYFFLWNPCTRELKELPDEPNYKHDLIRNYGRIIHGFGYDHTIDDYKVIKFVPLNYFDNDGRGQDHNNVLYFEVNVYTLGSNSWTRKIKTLKLLDRYSHETWKYRETGFKSRSQHIPNRVLTRSGGALNWIIRSSKNYVAIVSFDISKEEFRMIQLPFSVSRIYRKVGPDSNLLDLRVLNECLYLFQSSEAHLSVFDVWMMKNYDYDTTTTTEFLWTKLFSIDMRPILQIYPSARNSESEWFQNFLPLKQCKEDKEGRGMLIMLWGKRFIIAYDPNRDKIASFHRINEGLVEETYIKTLVSLKSGRYLTPIPCRCRVKNYYNRIRRRTRPTTELKTQGETRN